MFSLNNLRTHKAADCLTASEVSGDTKSLGTSEPTASTISWLPMLAMHCSARQTLTGLRLERSFLMLWTISLISSLLALTSTDMNRYPCIKKIITGSEWPRLYKALTLVSEVSWRLKEPKDVSERVG